MHSMMSIHSPLPIGECGQEDWPLPPDHSMDIHSPTTTSKSPIFPKQLPLEMLLNPMDIPSPSTIPKNPTPHTLRHFQRGLNSRNIHSQATNRGCRIFEILMPRSNKRKNSKSQVSSSQGNPFSFNHFNTSSSPAVAAM